MRDDINWGPSEIYEPEIQEYDLENNHDSKMIAGWWILPCVLLGSLCWVGIFYLIFG